MSSRNIILQRVNVRDNQPCPRELPVIPKFHSGQPVDLKKQFAAALKELSREVVAEPPADFDEFLRNRFPDAKTICSAVPEHAGNQTAGRLHSLVGRQPCRRYDRAFSPRRGRNRFGPVLGGRVPR